MLSEAPQYQGNDRLGRLAAAQGQAEVRVGASLANVQCDAVGVAVGTAMLRP